MFRYRDYVITRRGEPAYVIRPLGSTGREEYLIMLMNGTAQIVTGDNLRPADEVFTTGFGRSRWDSVERRTTERRVRERRHGLEIEVEPTNPERRIVERRGEDRRWVIQPSAMRDHVLQ